MILPIMFKWYIRPPAGPIPDTSTLKFPSSHMALQHTYSTPQHRCGLPGLPLDIHPEIFWLLSSRDILNYGLTCRAIFRVFEIFVFLRYKRALYKQGLRDNPRSDLALKARWALLLDRTRAWNELKPDGDPDAPVKGLLDLDHIALSPFAFVAGDFTSSPSRPLISRLHFPHRIVESSGDLSFEHGNYYRTPLESPMQNIMQNIKIIGIGSAILEHDSYVYVIRYVGVFSPQGIFAAIIIYLIYR